MGTRNLTCVYHKQKYKVAQYCQWDGYPSGVGSEVLDFLRDLDIPNFRLQVEKASFITDEEYERLLVNCGYIPDKSNTGFVSNTVWSKFRKEHYFLCRDAGAEVLHYIKENTNPTVKLRNDLNFAADSLFCEWCYIIDLDERTFEVYGGFNHSPLTEQDRFYSLTPPSRVEYYPVKLLKKYDLSNLPTNENFLNDLES